MDLYCKRCGEPWELDSVYHGDFSPEEKESFLKGTGCPACRGKEECTKTINCSECDESEEYMSGSFRCGGKKFKRPFRATLAAALTDVLGDDTDGLAAEMEDAEYMLGSEFWE